MSGCSHSPLAMSGPPCTTFNTPGGRPASRASCASMRAELGSCSEGFRTKVLPQATAMGNMNDGSITRKVREQEGGAWTLFGRRENKGVAAGDGDGEHERRQHHGEVERRNAGAHTQRLDHRVDVNTTGGVLGVFAQLQAGDGAGVLDHLEPATPLACG